MMDTKPPIKFIHITKTAGTSIEAAGKRAGYLWGKGDAAYLKTFERRKFKNANVYHVPLRYFKRNPYEGFRLFTVVRNPYERCISEYYCPWMGNKNPDASKLEFNVWIFIKLLRRNTVSFLPQYLYIYDEKGRQIVDDILYFENLDSEFSLLMNKYGEDLSLEKTNRARFPKKFTVDDFYFFTKTLIKIKFRRDFDLLAYDS
jgi:hypothetical protein